MEQGRPLLKRLMRYRLLLREESAIASIGIALAAVILTVMAAFAWWTLRAQKSSLQNARAEQVRALARILSQNCDFLLDSGELSNARRFVVEAARNTGLDRCRIVLADGSVLADADPSGITLQSIPESWHGSGAAAEDRIIQGRLRMVCPLSMDGGAAHLEIQTDVSPPFRAYWEAQTGVGVIGALALTGFLLIYRHMRSKLHAITAIREALMAAAEGERRLAALSVNADLGPEGRAWNDLLTEKQLLSEQLLADKARENLVARTDTRSDLDAACDALSQGLLVVDAKLTVSYANGAAAVFLKAKREDMLNSDIRRLVTDEAVLRAVETIAGGEFRKRTSIEVERDGKHGASVFRFTIRPVRREDTAAAMIFIEDITQQRIAQNSRNAFVAQATHELRTPLTNIRLYVETAIEDGESDPTVRAKCLNVINHEARRLERIVGEILSVSEIEAGSLKIRKDDVRLDSLFDLLKEDYLEQADEKNITLKFDLPPKLPVISGDRDKIALSLHNLIGNALKYTPAGGSVTVKVQCDQAKLSVAVTDTGIGIKPEETERIFERFYRAKDSRVAGITGSGLGLVLAREVARLHGGDITVTSQPDKGSTFTLTLPALMEVAI